MKKFNGMLRKILIFPILSSFIFTNLAYGIPIKQTIQDNLSTPVTSPDNPFTDEIALEMKNTMEDVSFQAIVIRIAEHFLKYNFGRDTLIEELRDVFTSDQKFFKWQDCIITHVVEKDDTVYLRFTKNNKKGIVKIWAKSNGDKNDSQAVVIGNYFVLIKKDDNDFPVENKDLKGPFAPESNKLVEKLIGEDLVCEVYIDPETGALKANKVKSIENYIPGITPKDLYLGQEMNIYTLFTPDERNKIEQWMKANPVRGSPVKFRIVLSSASLGWNGSSEHSNISHAGVRDSAIYIGDLLLKELLRDENKNLWEDVIERDELRHLKGLDHGNDNEYASRLARIEPVIKYLEAVWKVMVTEDVKTILSELTESLDEIKEGSSSRFTPFLDSCKRGSYGTFNLSGGSQLLF